ncbi:MAG TPA: hypothetical protein VFU38_03365 [Candidatus Krumholzibacteria bacterium]|nr:hypothetical protein [Candidatus Krumholzibacteria bacterium]
MPVAIQIEPEHKLVTFQCSGTVGLDDVRGAFHGMFADPRFSPGINALWDLRNASIGVRMQEIPGLLEMVNARQKDRGRDYRVAILVAGSPDFGLSTLFEMSAHSMPFAVRVFRSRTEATRWLEGTDA